MSRTCSRCHFENPDEATFCGNCAAPLKEKRVTGESATLTLDLSDRGIKTGAVIAGRYRIIECLGEGGMGKVYKAYDLEVHEDIALKLIRPEIAGNLRMIQRFQNELKLARKIAHVNVCRMFDLGKEGSARFITMEYVPGEDLKSTIRRIGPLTVRTAISIGKQICQGLSAAHSLGVIHRDLKPSNVMIDRNGIVRIMDFGIALSGETEGVTDSGAIVGTIPYIAPELIKGGKPGPASDVYSLGVIFYEMATGRTPFSGDSTPGAAPKQVRETARAPAALNPEVPVAMSRLIMRCLAMDPAKRFGTVEEVCAELRRIEEDLPTATEGSKLTNLWAMIRPQPALRKVLIVGLPLAVLAAAIAILTGHRREPYRQEAVPPWKTSIVVLPFKHLNPGAGQEYLWPTVTDMIIRNLDKTRELKVINYQTALQYRDLSLSDGDIRKKLDVDNALQGTITSKEEGLDLRVELRDLRKDKELFSRSYPAANEKEVYKVLDEISRMVTDKLGVELGLHSSPGARSRSSTDPGAQRYYRYGLHFQDEFLRTDRDEDFASCVENYEKAVALDPRFALVYWRLGMIYEIKYNRDKQADDLDKMFRYLKTAYGQDPDLAEANLGMGWVYFNREDHDKAYEFFRRAYELDVNSAEVNYHIGSFLRSLGLFDQARTHYIRALALDPYPGDFAEWHRVLADSNNWLGDVKAAADILQEGIKGNPDYHLRLDYAVCMIKLGNYEEAGKRIEEVRLEAEGPEKTRRYEALLMAFLGKREAALDLMKNDDNKANQVAVSVHAVLGLKDLAIEGIKLGQKGFQRYRWYPYSYLVLKNNPFFDNLRAEPAFRAIFEKERALFEERLRKFGSL